MSDRFLILYINSAPRKVPNEAIEKALDTDDWIRLKGGNVYFVASQRDADQLTEVIRPILHEDDTFIFLEANPADIAGWMPSQVKRWVLKYRPAKATKRRAGG